MGPSALMTDSWKRQLWEYGAFCSQTREIERKATGMEPSAQRFMERKATEWGLLLKNRFMEKKAFSSKTERRTGKL